MELSKEFYKTESLGYLGLRLATIKELDLVDKFNKQLPLNLEKCGKIYHGYRSAAVILSGLG